MIFLIIDFIFVTDLLTRFNENNSTKIDISLFNNYKQIEFNVSIKDLKDKIHSVIFHYGETLTSRSFRLKLKKNKHIISDFDSLDNFYNTNQKYQDFLNKNLTDGKKFSDIKIDNFKDELQFLPEKLYEIVNLINFGARLFENNPKGEIEYLNTHVVPIFRPMTYENALDNLIIKKGVGFFTLKLNKNECFKTDLIEFDEEHNQTTDLVVEDQNLAVEGSDKKLSKAVITIIIFSIIFAVILVIAIIYYVISKIKKKKSEAYAKQYLSL